jgi:shikimate dehydrogenase
MYKLAVIGNPIAHSMSPTIFGLFAKEFGIDLIYDKLLAQDNTHFTTVVTDFFANDGLALNITSPFKHAAFNLADIATTRAKFCAAANFLRLNDSGDIVADTTDGIGLLQDIQINKGFSLKNKKLLILGSGFVLDSILLDFIIANPMSIDILARNPERVDYLTHKFGVDRFAVDKKYDFILNTVPNQVENVLLPQIKHLASDSVCYDMAYSDLALNKFYNHVKSLNSNVEVHSGIGMLIEQAFVAFEELFGVTPNTQQVLSIFKTSISV